MSVLPPGPAVRTAVAAADPDQSVSHIPGEPGLWVFIFGDLALFAVLFGAFVYNRDQHPAAFAHAQTGLNAAFGLANTLLLLTSSLAVATAVRAVGAGRRHVASVGLGVALLCGVAFLVNKALEWTSLLSHGHSPRGEGFFMYFFVMTGLHALHLLLGMGVLTHLLVLTRKGDLTPRRLAFIEGGACYWHLVDLLWLVLFALLYLAH